MPINPNRPLILVPPAIVLARKVRFIELSADGVNGIVEVEIATNVWRAASYNKTTGVGSVIDNSNQVLAGTLRNGENVVSNYSWISGHLAGGTNNNTNVVATVTVPVVVDP